MKLAVANYYKSLIKISSVKLIEDCNKTIL